MRPQDWLALALLRYATRDKSYPVHLRFALHVTMEKWIETPKKLRNNCKRIPAFLW